MNTLTRFDKYIHRQNTEHFHHLEKISCPLCGQSSLCPQPLATIDLYSICIVLSFEECHVNGIIQYLTICFWLLSLRVMLLRFTHDCFHSSFLALRSMSLCQYITIRSPLYPLISIGLSMIKMLRSCP